jgi:hypothetical protein
MYHGNRFVNGADIEGYNAKLLGRLSADGDIPVSPLDVATRSERERPKNHLHFCVILDIERDDWTLRMCAHLSGGVPKVE